MKETPIYEQKYNMIYSMACDEFAGNGYKVDDQEVIIADDGKVYRIADNDTAFPFEEVTDPEIIKKVKEQAETDQLITDSRFQLSAELAKNNEIMRDIIRLHLEYNRGKVHVTEHDGITFYAVGRNASHCFYLGMKDGKLYKMSCGESGKEDEDGFPEIEENVYEVKDPNNLGYLGHF